MSEADFQLALAIRRIQKQYGTLGKFFEAQEAERKRTNRAKWEEQMRQLNAS